MLVYKDYNGKKNFLTYKKVLKRSSSSVLLAHSLIKKRNVQVKGMLAMDNHTFINIILIKCEMKNG